MRTTSSVSPADRILVALAVVVALLGALATGLVDLAATGDCISAPGPGAPGPAPCGEAFSQIRVGLVVQLLLATTGVAALLRGRTSVALGSVLGAASLVTVAVSATHP